MHSAMNKHGFIGVRKRTDAWRRKPFYARISVANEQFVYSPNFPTAEEAAAEFERMRAAFLHEEQQP
jgi:hypothetical protein